MGNALEYERPDLPAFASMRTSNGVTQLKVRVVFGTPFKRTVVYSVVAWFAAFIAYVWVLILLHGLSTLGRWLPMLGGAVFGLTFLVGLMLLGLLAAVSAMSGEITVEQDKVRFKDYGASYSVPLADIRAIRQIEYSGSRLEADTAGPLNHLFFHGKKTALEIELPEGRIEVFHFWGQPR